MTELEKQIAQMEEKLRKNPNEVTSQEYKKLYELTGLLMERQHGVSLAHNPCSLAVITHTVLAMASRVKPCRLLNVGIGGFPQLDIELRKRGFDVTGIEYAYSLASLAYRSSRAAGTPLRIVTGDAHNA
jgi:hypothetical protein